MSDREKLLNLTREATAKIANHCANTSCEKCAKESGKYDKESGKCKCSTMEMFTDHLIANGVTVQQWIPVSERFPSEKEYCIVHYVHTYCDNDDYWAIGTSFFNGNQFQIGSAYKVTHWMPIPEPPKGAQK